MEELINSIVCTVKTMCDNELDEDAILNMFFAKFGSVMACKNILTNSSRHIKPFPIAYYALNLLPSGGNKTKPYGIIKGFYDWLDEEYNYRNKINKSNYIEEKLYNLDEKAKKIKIKEIEKETEKLFCIGQNTNGATSSKIYLKAQAIKYMKFGSLFFYDTEFFEKFEKLNQKNNYDNTLNLIYNLFDGYVDAVDTVLTNRQEIEGLSCSVCFASAYSRLMRDAKLFNRFKEYLCNGFARRIFLYVSNENNSANIIKTPPNLNDIYNAKNKIPFIINELKNLYNEAIEGGIYQFTRKADSIINEYHRSLSGIIKEKFSFADVLPIEDEILKVELENSTWKTIKLAFILHLLKEPGSLAVGEDSVIRAIDFYKNMSKYFNILLDKKALDEDDKIFIFINKNLGKEIDINNNFKKLFNNTIKHNWKKFKNEELQDLLEQLQSKGVYYCRKQEGKKEYIRFYKKDNNTDDLTEL